MIIDMIKKMDILIKKVIFTITFSFFIIVNILIKIDYIKEDLLSLITRITENMCIQKEIIGIKIINLEKKMK